MMEDDDEVLAWKTLEDHDEHTGEDHHHHHHSHHHSVDHVHTHAHGGGIPSGTDDDVEDFAELAYDHERTSTSTVATAGAGDAHPPHSLLQLQQHERHASHSHHHHHSHHHGQHTRIKRKNFSKQLQLHCLQHYAQYAKEHGKLPDKTECQLLLNQSYLQFLKDGGAPDEPRLSHQEFLKLIRNRRREMYVRAQKLKFPHVSSSTTVANASTLSADGGGGVSSDASAAGGIISQPLSAAKRKLQQEHAKIYELIEIIDQAREQSGLVSDHNHNRQSVRVPQSSQRSGKRRASTKSVPLQQQQSTAHEHQQHHHHHHHHHHQHQRQLVADPQDQIRAIFRIQQETLEIQREIAERLKVIRLHRSLRQHDPMEPSSASV